VTTFGEPSACTTWDAVAYRSSGFLANARVTTSSSSAVTSVRAARTAGGGSVNRLVIRACTDPPVKGATPASIS
jgi:hypothetical protein